MWTTLKKRCPHAHSPNKCKCKPRNNIDQEAALASPHSAHHSQAPRQPAHRFPRGGSFLNRNLMDAAVEEHQIRRDANPTMEIEMLTLFPPPPSSSAQIGPPCRRCGLGKTGGDDKRRRTI